MTGHWRSLLTCNGFRQFHNLRVNDFIMTSSWRHVVRNRALVNCPLDRLPFEIIGSDPSEVTDSPRTRISSIRISLFERWNPNSFLYLEVKHFSQAVSLFDLPKRLTSNSETINGKSVPWYRRYKNFSFRSFSKLFYFLTGYMIKHP